MDNFLLSMEHWLVGLRSNFADIRPDLLYLFDTYAEEAIFGRCYIAHTLSHLGPDARILEVGAGSLLLSCQLAREGFHVTALEPTGEGFSHFEQMRQLLLCRVVADDCLPRVLDIAAEALAECDSFDFAFSINVMEHVNDVEQVIINVFNSLKENAYYDFTCPNYLFPYEPHFNIPTLFSKRLTEKVFRKHIYNNNKIPDQKGTWESLNWISVTQIRKIALRIPQARITFNRRLFVSTMERIAHDPNFASRRSPAVCTIISLLVRLRLHLLLQLVPAAFQPVMDCRLKKIPYSEMHEWPK